MLTHTITHNIYPNQSFSIHISSQTKSIILQNPSDTNFLQNPSLHQTQISLFYKTHQCLEKLKKTLKHKQNQNRAPEQKLWNTNIENLEEHKTEQGGFMEGERENVVT